MSSSASSAKAVSSAKASSAKASSAKAVSSAKAMKPKASSAKASSAEASSSAKAMKPKDAPAKAAKAERNEEKMQEYANITIPVTLPPAIEALRKKWDPFGNEKARIRVGRLTHEGYANIKEHLNNISKAEQFKIVIFKESCSYGGVSLKPSMYTIKKVDKLAREIGQTLYAKDKRISVAWGAEFKKSGDFLKICEEVKAAMGEFPFEALATEVEVMVYRREDGKSVLLKSKKIALKQPEPKVGGKKQKKVKKVDKKVEKKVKKVEKKVKK